LLSDDDKRKKAIIFRDKIYFKKIINVNKVVFGKEYYENQKKAK
jgi:hypothetical protein